MRFLVLGMLVFLTALGGGYFFASYVEQVENQRLENPLPAEEPAQEAEPQAPIPAFRIVVNLANRSLSFYENGIKTHFYPVAVGKEWTPTPLGHFVVEDKQEYPAWGDPHREGVVIPPGENNPLGTRWMGIGGYYGIHGTNVPSSIGNYISNGCIRMFDEDVCELFPLVPVGTPVDIVYERLVLDRLMDGTVNLYCYPDGYEWQSVGMKEAMAALQSVGLQDFADLDAVGAHIEASNGEPLFIAKSYSVWSKGKNLGFFAVETEDGLYLPVTPLFYAFGVQWEWDTEKQEIKAGFRRAPAVQRNTAMYMKAEYLEKALRLTGEVKEAGRFELSLKKKKTDGEKSLPAT